MSDPDSAPRGSAKAQPLILIVEDNEDLGLIIKTKVARAGFDVHWVTTGEAMLEFSRKNHPDIILLDYSLPDGTALEWVKRMKAQAVTSPFMAITGASDQSVAVDIMKLGALDYLIKDQSFLDNLIPSVERAYNKVETERRLAETEESLRLSEERFQLAVEGAHDGIWDWDGASNQLWCSSQACRLLGFEPGEFEPSLDQVWERVHPDDVNLVKKAFIDHIENERPFELECRVRKKDGEYNWFRARGQTICGAEGRPKRMAGSFEDISQRKRSEEELQLVSALMRAAEKITLTGGWRYDVVKKKLDWTPQVYRIFGLDYTHAPNLEDAVSYFLTEDQPRIRGLVDRAIEEGKSFDEFFQLKGADETTRWVRATGIPETAGGKVHYVTGAFQDITEQREGEDQRRFLEEQLRQSQKMETIGTLAGGIAHDFNNILAAIYGYVALAERRVGKDHAAIEDLEGIMAAAERAKELVQQILTFSRKSETELKPLLIKTVVSESLRLIRASIPTTVAFQNDIRARDSKVNGDPTEIEQVVINLCTNAYHSMQGKTGTIRNTLEEVEVDSHFARNNPPLSSGQYARYRIEDDGCGMDLNTQSRIFEPFFTTKNVGEGTGMGLAVVHGIVKKHQGAIFVDSKLNQGTRVDVYLPISHRDFEEISKRESDPPFGRGTILLVDDEEAVVLTTKLTLEDLGYRVMEHFDPESALEVFSKDPEGYDAVLSDFTMPHLNGIELSKKIRLIRGDIPIVIMTGFSDNLTGEELEKHGIHECLMKPFTSSTLAKSLRSCLSQKII